MAFNFNGNTPKKILYNGLNVAKLVYNGVVVWMSKVLATIEGILPLNLTDCTGDDLVDYKIYGNSEYEGLPDGYTQVEYLESTGTQYIDTGFKPTGNTKVKIKVQLPTQTNVQQGIFGARPGNTERFTAFIGTRGDALQVDYNTASTLGGSTVPISNFNATNVNEIEVSNKLIVNDVLVREVDKISFQSSVNLYLFTNNNNGTPQLRMKGMIWYCKIWDNDVLVRNFIPCINQSNVAGMYDTVNGVFYTNAGTGSFNVGSVVSKKSVGDLVTDTSDINYGKYKIPILTNSTATNIYLNKPLRKTSKLPTGYTQLEHIRSTGTQYINTGVNLSNNSNIEINAKLISTQRNISYYLFGSRIENKRYMIAVGGSTDKYLVDFISGSYRIDSLLSAFDGKFHTHKVTNLSYYIDEILQGSKSSLTITNTSSAYIFDVSGDGNTPVAHGAQSWEIKYCKIWNGNNLIRDFIPCKNPSNVVGMYDTVNDVFYSNAGSGSFIAGAEVETVYYTDYLDYENQKVVRNVDDNDKGIDTPVEESVVLPAVPTDEGTVTVDVDTEIAPSCAEIKYYKNGS